MSKVIFMGECMAELSAIEPGKLRYGFAGDVINTGVYLKRCFPTVKCSLLTAVGVDSLSKEMVEFFQRELLDVSNVLVSENRIPGIYLITTDSKGERGFSYWREQSAARKIIQLLDFDVKEQLMDADWFYFSGITLAIMDDTERRVFIQLLQQLKSRGVKLAFDSNFRSRLWSKLSDAKEIYRQVFSEIDLLFAGVEDFACLFQCPSPDLIVQNLAEYKIDEIIVKNGSFDIWYVTQDQHQILPVTPVERVVDTTSAGDSFNGVYLGARLKGRLPDEAIRLAAACAALVIQHSGAIIAPELIDDFKKSLDSST